MIKIMILILRNMIITRMILYKLFTKITLFIIKKMKIIYKDIFIYLYKYDFNENLY
jgi:hypothetical protein